MVGLEALERETEEYHRYIDWLEQARMWFVLAAMICAIGGFAANISGVSLSLYEHASAAATTVCAASSIALLGLAIGISGTTRRSGKRVALIILVAVLIAGVPHLLEAFGLPGLQLQIESGSIGVDTSLILILLAISVLSRFRAAFLGLGAGLGASALILNGIIGQTYGLPYFDGEMAFATLLALIFCMVATASLYLHRPLVRVMFMSGSIGFRTRTLMIVSFLAPWVCGMLLYRWYGVPERAFHVEATLISAIMWVMLAVTLASGFFHEKSDKERRAAERRLEQQALTDALTALPNRAAINATLADRWAHFRRFNVPVAIILMDLDHFKTINDTFGHDIGDAVLRAIRETVAPFLRKEDTVARWGGEEFICVLQNTELHHLQRISERLRAAISAISDLDALSHGKGRVDVTASFGVSTFQKGDKNYAAAIKRADEALYLAKRNGRNRVVFDAALRPTQLRRVRPRSALRA